MIPVQRVSEIPRHPTWIIAICHLTISTLPMMRMVCTFHVTNLMHFLNLSPGASPRGVGWTQGFAGWRLPLPVFYTCLYRHPPGYHTTDCLCSWSRQAVSVTLFIRKTPALAYCIHIFTARCTLVQSAVLQSHVVCLSVCLSVSLSVCNGGEL